MEFQNLEAGKNPYITVHTSDHMEEHHMGRWRNHRASPSPLDGDCLRCNGLVYLVGADRSTYCLDCLEATNELAEGAPTTPEVQPTPTPIYPDSSNENPDPLRDADPWARLQPVVAPAEPAAARPPKRGGFLFWGEHFGLPGAPFGLHPG